MIRWIEIRGTPLRQIHGRDALTYLAQGAHKHSILVSIGALRSETNGAVANLTFMTSNVYGETTAILSRLPLGAEVALVGVESGNVVEQFVGVLQRISLDETSVGWEVRA